MVWDGSAVMKCGSGKGSVTKDPEWSVGSSGRGGGREVCVFMGVEVKRRG